MCIGGATSAERLRWSSACIALVAGRYDEEISALGGCISPSSTTPTISEVSLLRVLVKWLDLVVRVHNL